MAFIFESKEFQGPLDLLLHLIGNAKINIADIFVSQVTDQYIRIVSQSEAMDMEEASEFIQMAATLLLIKSRSILPPSPEETENPDENPEATLIWQLEEYARFQQLAAQMQDFEEAASRLFSKLPDEYPPPPPQIELEGLTLEGLIAAFMKMQARFLGKEKEGLAPNRVIRLDEYSVPRCMGEILRKTKRGSLRFTDLFSENPSRNEVVTLFLALLELLKLGKLRVSQAHSQAEIVLNRNNKEVQPLET